MSKTAKQTNEEFEEKNDLAISLAVPPNHKSQNIPLHPDDEVIAENVTAAQSPEPEEDILSLPDDIRKNLIGFNTLEMETLLVKVLGRYTHPINVDRIVLTLWFDHKFKAERAVVLRQLRLMAAQGIVQKQEGTRGLYKLKPQPVTVAP